MAQGTSTAVGGISLSQQGDRHLVVYRGAKAIWASGVTGNCANNSCVLVFQEDGNLVSKQSNPFSLMFASETTGPISKTFTFKDECPYYLLIHDENRRAIWTNLKVPKGYFPNSECGH